MRPCSEKRILLVSARLWRGGCCAESCNTWDIASWWSHILRVFGSGPAESDGDASQQRCS